MSTWKRVVNTLLGTLPSIYHFNWGPSRHQSSHQAGRSTYGKMKRNEILEQFGVPFSTLTRDLSLFRECLDMESLYGYEHLCVRWVESSFGGQCHRRVAVSFLWTTSPPAITSWKRFDGSEVRPRSEMSEFTVQYCHQYADAGTAANGGIPTNQSERLRKAICGKDFLWITS